MFPNKSVLGWSLVGISCAIVAVGRFFYPGREVSWWECYPDFAHFVMGVLFTLGCLGKKVAWYPLAVLTILEIVMFAIFKGWL